MPTNLRPHDHLRAVFVLLHVAAIGLLSMPAPVGMRRSDLDDPQVATALADWHGALGLNTTEAQFADQVWEVGGGILQVRKRLLAPFERYYALTGTRQGWRMFGQVARTPARFELWADEGEGFRPLYVAGSSEAVWQASLLRGERFRTFINQFSWKTHRGAFDRMVEWLACKRQKELPTTIAYRAWMVKLKLPPADKLRQTGKIPEIGPFWETTLQSHELVCDGSRGGPAEAEQEEP
jgi:hypothetical protein